MTSPPQSIIDTVRVIRAGLGAEDIAVAGGHTPDVIRQHVKDLRAKGVLAELVRTARADAAVARRKARRK